MLDRLEKAHLLIVEGKDDKLFFEAFLASLNVQNVQVMPMGGKTKIREYLGTLVKTSGYSDVVSIGIIRDANSNPRAAFQSVCDALKQISLPIPKAAMETTRTRPAVSILILPDHDKIGMLEDVCLEGDMNDPAMSCALDFFDCLKRNGATLPRNLSKAKTQVFLASKPEVGKKLGEAAQAGYFNFKDKAFNRIESFLLALQA